MITIKAVKPFEFSGNSQYKIFVVDGEASDRAQITYDSEKKLLSRVPLDPNEYKEIEPFLVLPEFMFDAMLKFFVGYANENGIKPESESMLQGKLEKTEKHLEDMRTLVFEHFTKNAPTVVDK